MKELNTVISSVKTLSQPCFAEASQGAAVIRPPITNN